MERWGRDSDGGVGGDSDGGVGEIAMEGWERDSDGGVKGALQHFPTSEMTAYLK